MYKKLLSTLLALCMVLTLMPVAVAATADENKDEPTYTTAVMPDSLTATATANAAGARMTLQQLKDKFPDGKYWNGGNVDSTTGSPCPSHATTQYCNHFKTDGYDASQCYGFALKLGYDAYGVSPRFWDYRKENSYIDSGELKRGDIISSDAPKDHTVFVIGVTDTQVIVGECNWGKNCIISWGRAINKSEIRNWTIFKIYIAPCELPIGGDTPTPTPPPSNDVLTVSANAVSVNAGQTASVNLTVNRSKKFTTHVEIADSSICSGKWGYDSFRGSGSKWTNSLILTGLKGGSTSVKVDLYDERSGTLLDTEIITVTVVPPPAQKVDLKLDAWISPKGQGFSLEQAAQDRISEGKVGQYYYLWFKLYDKNTGKRLNELYSYDYNSNMTIIAPDGTQHTTDYKSSDNNWRGFPVNAAGIYTCKITFTGDVKGTGSFTFAVAADKLIMTPDKTSITIEAGKSAVCNLTASRTTQTKYVDKTVANGDICDAAFGELSYPSDSTVFIPMHITGKKVGQTTVTACILDPNRNKLVASSPITVTVTAPPTPATVTLDKNEISITAGEKASVNATFQTNGATMKADYKIGDSGICSAAWDESASVGNKRKLDILGLSEGKTNITVYLKDSNGNTVASQEVAVSVKEAQVPVKLNTSAASVSIEEGDSQSIEISWSGTVPAGSKISVSATPDPNRAGSISLRWGNKGSTSRTIMVTGNREGGSALNIALKDSNGNVLASTSVSVLVSAKREEASVSLSPASITMKFLENRAIIASYQGDYYKRVIESNGSGVFIASMDGTDYPGSSETISVTGIKAGTGACRVVLEDEYGNELASAVLNVTVIDDTSLDDDVNSDGDDSDDYTYSTPSISVRDPIMAQPAAKSAREYNTELEDEIVGGGGQNSILDGFSASGSTEIKADSAAADTGGVNTGNNTGKEEIVAIKDIPAGASTNAGASTGTSSMTVSVTISDPASSSPSVTTQGLRFTDVISGKYYYEPVAWAEQTGVTAGITGTTLNPNGNCPRGQVVEFIWRTLGCPKPKLTENPFTDVDSNDSYYDAVLWAYESSVTTGTSKTAFSPNDTCTRGQVMTFLWRAKGKPTVSGGNPFTDVTDTAYYADAVNWAVETAITTGTSATSFSPKDLCSRAQILTFLYRSISGGVGKS